ncbi:MAG: hypothetical protein JWR61_2668 [Ferruginibacter sp.]|nr:hypothetical protein [Ferruginibacter sp.]
MEKVLTLKCMTITTGFQLHSNIFFKVVFIFTLGR